MDGNLAFRTAIYHTEKEWERNTDLESTAALLSRKRHTDGLELEMTGKVTDKLEVFAGLAVMKARVDDQYDGTPGATFAAVTNNGTATGPTGLAGTGYASLNGVSESTDAGQAVYANRSVQTSEGKRPRNTPDATLNIWTTYKFSPGWKAGLGLEAKAERFGYGVGTCNTATQITTAGPNLGKWQYNNCSTAAFNPNTLAGYMRLDAMVTYEAKAWSVRLNVKNLLDKTYYDSLYDNGAFSVPGNGRQAILTTEYRF